jgi:succinate-acetate transporter protein
MSTSHVAEPGTPISRSAAQSAPPAAPAAELRFADPAALGLGAFAMTTFVLSFANSGIISSVSSVLGLALFYGGITQFVAGLWEFANKNTFGATAFCSFGAFWLAFWWLVTTKGALVAAGPAGIGTFDLAWGIFTLYMVFAAIKTNGAILAVLIALTVTFFLLAIGAYASNMTITHLGGYVGFATAILAWYASFAIVFNSTYKRAVLPVFPSRG